MADAPTGAPSAPPAPPAAGTPPATPPLRRGPGHRGQDIRDTVAEMAAKAQEISMEAGSKMAAAMKDVINAAAGISSFAIESARDLVQYMVRRGQMTQEEADKLIRDVEEAQSKGGKAAARPAPVAAVAEKPATRTTVAKPAAPARPAAKPAPKPVAKTVAPAKKSPAPAAKKAAKPAAKKAPAKKR